MSEKKNKKNVAIVDDNFEEEVESDGATDSDQESVASADPIEQLDPLEQLRGEMAEWKDKYLRSKAEQQNIARRSSNEISEALRYAGTGLLKSVIEVMDDLDRTVEAVDGADGNNSENALLDGVRLVRDKLQKILTDNHVEIIDASDAVFDPMQHEALMQQPSADHEPGRVMQQIQKGYRLHDRVLRAAKVIVSASAVDGDDANGSDEATAFNE